MKKLVGAPLLLCAICLSALAASALHPITDIGTLGGDYSYPQASNARGDVVGYAYTPGNASHRAFLWTASGGIQDLGSLGGNYSYATGINERGEVIGFSSRSDGSQGSFFWSAATGMIDLGSLSSFNNYTQVQDINDNGAVTGYAYTDSGNYHAFKWSQATGMVDLGTLGGSYSYATKINNAGQVTGFSYVNDSNGYYYYNHHTFFHSDATGIVDVGTLGTSNSNCGNYYYYCYDYSYPQDMNEAGEIVGYSYNGSQQYAFYWSQAAGLVDMGQQNGSYAYAYDINDAGQAVGLAYSNNNATHSAFVWTLAGGQQAVATLPGDTYSYLHRINEAGQAIGQSYGSSQRSVFWSAATGSVEIPPLAGASYIYAQAINDLGQVVGQAQTAVNNAYHAFVWTAAAGTEDLGTLNESINSHAFLISNNGQATGVSHIDAGGYGPQHAVVWDAGSRDTTPPVISLVGDAMVGVEACASYSDAGATALDDKDGDLTAAIVVSGGVTANTPGSYTLRYNVSDAAGNAAVEVTRTVQVADTTPPVIGNVSINPTSLWPANHKMVNASLSYTAVDSCSTAVNCNIAVTSNEPVSGTGDGDTAPDWSVTSDHYLQLRAERAGSGNGRVYSVALRCVDVSGNASSAIQQVTVPKSQKK